ncbi:hypothetical protein BPA30113_01233 [Burkholderia paludis]|uniref:Uncharacterized protein n=1 Tax=Burkholderia paludis TaxID=1506587 RepID=A0A6P2IL59_9BURK|nr:hypothetical protein LMG30113_04452 [Burkholderia paludis]VWB31688.1 hypothetical protein BPA30113_01233 [Burkholderia paludis]
MASGRVPNTIRIFFIVILVKPPRTERPRSWREACIQAAPPVPAPGRHVVVSRSERAILSARTASRESSYHRRPVAFDRSNRAWRLAASGIAPVRHAPSTTAIFKPAALCPRPVHAAHGPYSQRAAERFTTATRAASTRKRDTDGHPGDRTIRSTTSSDESRMHVRHTLRVVRHESAERRCVVSIHSFRQCSAQRASDRPSIALAGHATSFTSHELTGREMLRMCNAARERAGCIGVRFIRCVPRHAMRSHPGRCTRNERRATHRDARPRRQGGTGSADESPGTSRTRQTKPVVHGRSTHVQADSSMNQNAPPPRGPHARPAPRSLLRAASRPMAHALLHHAQASPDARARQRTDGNTEATKPDDDASAGNEGQAFLHVRRVAAPRRDTRDPRAVFGLACAEPVRARAYRLQPRAHRLQGEPSHDIDTPAGRDAANAARGDDCTGPPRRRPRT